MCSDKNFNKKRHQRVLKKKKISETESTLITIEEETGGTTLCLGNRRLKVYVTNKKFQKLKIVLITNKVFTCKIIKEDKTVKNFKTPCIHSIIKISERHH